MKKNGWDTSPSEVLIRYASLNTAFNVSMLTKHKCVHSTPRRFGKTFRCSKKGRKKCNRQKVRSAHSGLFQRAVAASPRSFGWPNRTDHGADWTCIVTCVHSIGIFAACLALTMKCEIGASSAPCTIVMCCVPCMNGLAAPHKPTRSSSCALASQSSSPLHGVRPGSCWSAWSSNGMRLKQ